MHVSFCQGNTGFSEGGVGLIFSWSVRSLKVLSSVLKHIGPASVTVEKVKAGVPSFLPLNNKRTGPIASVSP
jgi:hypothetical protein